MKVAYTISGVGHAAVLLWSIWSLAAKPLPAPPPESLPVDIVSVSEFTQMTAGNKDAPKTETPQPLAEKIDEPKPVEDVTAKVVEKKEVKAAREPPPAPEPKPVEQKPEKAEPKSDPIAEALAKEQAKKPETKKAEAKTPTPPKKPAPPVPKFDAKEIEKKLLDKQDATRLAAAGTVLSPKPGAGLSKANADQASLSELDAFKRRLGECWTPPPGVTSSTKLQVIIRAQFKPDASVARLDLVEGPASAMGPPMAESAKRALLTCQPFKMLSPERYDVWKDIEINFDPTEMFRG
jgi:outer membrane biosynthesis protein TonB